MIRGLVATLAILLASLVVGMTSVSADSPADATAQRATHTVTVKADRVIDSVEYPAGSGNCSTYLFYEFPDVPGTQSGILTYLFQGGEAAKLTYPPYNDVYNSPPRTAPPGRHRIYIGYSAYSGPGQGTTECQGYVAYFEANYSPTGTVELTVEGESPECIAARKKLEKAGEKVSKLKAQIRDESNPTKKKRLKDKLKQAKKKQARAKKDVVAACEEPS